MIRLNRYFRRHHTYETLRASKHRIMEHNRKKPSTKSKVSLPLKINIKRREN